MNFVPKSEDDCRTIMPKGDYPFEIVGAEDKTSKKGNEMIELKVRLYRGETCVGQVFDYLLEAMAYKLRHCAYACGLGDKYESGLISASDFVGCTGVAQVSVEQRDGFPPRNKIDDYATSKSGQSQNTELHNAEPNINDDLPF